MHSWLEVLPVLAWDFDLVIHSMSYRNLFGLKTVRHQPEVIRQSLSVSKRKPHQLKRRKREARAIMNNPAQKVGEIFREAAKAFDKLSELTLLLHPMGETQPAGKWTEEEVEMLRGCVHRFAIDLNKLSQHIKNRTVSQICTTLKKKAFEDAGLPVRPVSSKSVANHVNNHSLLQAPAPAPEHVTPLTPMTVVNTHTVLGKNAEVTLNMLNATENEVDVEGLTGEVKLEFDTSNEDVAT